MSAEESSLPSSTTALSTSETLIKEFVLLVVKEDTVDGGDRDEVIGNDRG
jgi:hypothetical protein